MLKKGLKLLGVFFCFIIALAILWYLIPEKTPPITKSSGNSISTIEYVDIGGINQCILIRSRDIHNPLLLFLHGGPGMPMMYMAHEFQKPLEDHFTVVQWDRRGAGKTYARNEVSPESMNVRQLLQDAYDLIDTLRDRFGQEKIYLVGHSFGSYIGSIMVSEKPELFNAYLSIGQVVNESRARALQKNFIQRMAEQSNQDEIVSQLNEEDISLESWLFEFGGELKNSTTFFPLIWSGLRSPEYTLMDAITLAAGSSFSSNSMQYNVLNGEVGDEILEYKVPVFFFVGQHDYTTPHELITEYYHIIEAPQKKIYYFQNAAHFPFFEEPEAFCERVINCLLTEK